jgi:hypothetical protein
MRITYDHLLLAALSSGIALVVLANGDAFMRLGAFLGG